MLERLKLQNVGPAPSMDLTLAPRINLITGDLTDNDWPIAITHLIVPGDIVHTGQTRSSKTTLAKR